MVRNRSTIQLGEFGFISVAICEADSVLSTRRFFSYTRFRRGPVFLNLVLSQYQGTSYRIIVSAEFLLNRGPL